MEAVVVNTAFPPPYPAGVPRTDTSNDFAQRLAAIRKKRGVTLQQLADRVKVHVQHLKRYEAGSSQPTLDVRRPIAKALNVTSDRLLFGDEERGPDDNLRPQFEAVNCFDPDEKQVVRSLLEGMILKHEARRWSSYSLERSNNGGKK